MTYLRKVTLLRFIAQITTRIIREPNKCSVFIIYTEFIEKNTLKSS